MSSLYFKKLARRINLSAILEYLGNAGWAEYPQKNPYVKVFQREQGEEFYQVTVPMSEILSDYEDAMYRVVDTIASAETLEVPQAILLLLSHRADTLNIQFEEEDSETGYMTLNRVVSRLQSIKKLLKSAAESVPKPEYCHQKSSNGLIKKFLSSCQYGQAEIGSNVIPIVCPFIDIGGGDGGNQLILSNEIDCCDNQFPRTVITQLMQNLSVIRAALDSNEPERLFDLVNSDRNRIGINFYKALIGLFPSSKGVKQSKGFAVNFSVNWDFTGRRGDNRQDRIALSDKDCQQIKRIVQKRD